MPHQELERGQLHLRCPSAAETTAKVMSGSGLRFAVGAPGMTHQKRAKLHVESRKRVTPVPEQICTYVSLLQQISSTVGSIKGSGTQWPHRGPINQSLSAPQGERRITIGRRTCDVQSPKCCNCRQLQSVRDSWPIGHVGHRQDVAKRACRRSPTIVFRCASRYVQKVQTTARPRPP